jgi:hypothetical protein
MTAKNDTISAKFNETSEVELAEKATNLRRWAEAVESKEFQHAPGAFTKGDSEGGDTGPGRFQKGGGGGIKKHRCVWGALADLRVQDGVGSWSYGGYSDETQVGQNMPSQQLAAFVGLNDGDVVADITKQYMAQHMGPEYALRNSSVPSSFVSYNDSHRSYGVLSKVMKDTAADIERRLAERKAAVAS